MSSRRFVYDLTPWLSLTLEDQFSGVELWLILLMMMPHSCCQRVMASPYFALKNEVVKKEFWTGPLKYYVLLFCFWWNLSSCLAKYTTTSNIVRTISLPWSKFYATDLRLFTSKTSSLLLHSIPPTPTNLYSFWRHFG